MSAIKLYGYFRSSTTYRVRIALQVKAVSFETVPVNLVKAEQRGADYLALNPQGRVPTLFHGDTILTQSMAIIEYLDDIYPENKLVFGDAAQKAYIRRLSQLIACDSHPMTNLNVLQYLTGTLGANDAQKDQWYADFATAAMVAFEAALAWEGRSGLYCCGDTVSMADLCLIPQMYNLRRFNIALDAFPLCRAIEENCMKLTAFQMAAPEMQPDAPSDLVPIHGPHAPFLRNAA
ncbi:MAG: maleylacetoacetate isomerase [Alphaproteobacteria bacterium]|nr:maleylacetoacetate isomerase [Alphaproteobacteria bacterium]